MSGYIVRPSPRPLYFRVYDSDDHLVLETLFAREAKQRAGDISGRVVDSDGYDVHVSAQFKNGRNR